MARHYHRGKGDPPVEVTLPITPMLDMSFQLLFYFVMTFQAANALEGYERLILLAMLGDQSLFTRADGIERVWEISQPLLESPPPVQPYARGSWGPEAAEKLIDPYNWYLR